MNNNYNVIPAPMTEESSFSSSAIKGLNNIVKKLVRESSIDISKGNHRNNAQVYFSPLPQGFIKGGILNEFIYPTEYLMDSSPLMRSLFSDMFVFRLTTPVRTNNNGPQGFWTHMIVWNHPLIEKVPEIEEAKNEELAS